ncbi:MAG: hypothetical protein HZR80_21065 [Candidatus Heimdallarchaeota archaeon]
MSVKTTKKVDERDYYPSLLKRGISLIQNINNGIEIKYALELKQWIDCNREFDILIAFKTPTRKEKRLLSIEVKKDSNAQTLFHQGLVRSQLADYCYLAFPLQHLSYYWFKATEYYIHYKKINKPFTFGLMTFDLITKKIFILNYARQNKKLLNQTWKNKLFNAIMNGEEK